VFPCQLHDPANMLQSIHLFLDSAPSQCKSRATALATATEHSATCELLTIYIESVLHFGQLGVAEMASPTSHELSRDRLARMQPADRQLLNSAPRFAWDLERKDLGDQPRPSHRHPAINAFALTLSKTN